MCGTTKDKGTRRDKGVDGRVCRVVSSDGWANKGEEPRQGLTKAAGVWTRGKDRVKDQQGEGPRHQGK